MPRRFRSRSVNGFTVTEVLVAMMLSILVGAAIVRALLGSEEFAGRSRLMTNARAIVQRNCSAATGALFMGPSSAPGILAYSTTQGGDVCQDTGGPTENISLTLNSGTVLVSGTLRKTVVDESTPSSLSSLGPLPVRRITFRIDYDYRARHYTYSESVVRSQDQ